MSGHHRSSRVLLPRSPALPPRSHDRGGHIAERRRLLEDVRRSTGDIRRRKAFGALRAFLRKENNASSVTAILGTLNSSNIPPSVDEVFTSQESRDCVEHAMSALSDLHAVLACVGSEPQPTRFRRIETLSFRALIQGWHCITKWLAFLLMVSLSATNTRFILNLCYQILDQVIITPNYEDVKGELELLTDELLTLPQTIDLVFLFIAERDPKTGKRLLLHNSDGSCSFTDLLCQYLMDEQTFQVMLQRLPDLKLTTRRAILCSIVERSEEMAYDAVARPMQEWKVVDAVRSIGNLIFCTADNLPERSFYACFADCDFILRCMAGLDMVSKAVHARWAEVQHEEPLDLFWMSIGEQTIKMVQTIVMEHTRSPIEAFPSALQGGAIDIILRAICHLPPEGNEAQALVADVLPICASHLTVRRVWTTATAQRAPGMDLLRQASKTSRLANVACNVLYNAVRRGGKTYGETGSLERVKGVNICANRRHAGVPSNLNVPTLEALEVKYRACSGCRMVLYCSEKCQREDWDAFHRQECGEALKLHQGCKGLGPRSSASLRRDHILYLEDRAEEYLTSSWRIVPGCAEESGKSGRNATTVALFDFVSGIGLLHKVDYPLSEYHGTLKGVNEPWADRILSMIKEVEESDIADITNSHRPRNSYALVEGIFIYNASTNIFVLAKMRWDDRASDGRHFKVEDSVWRLGPRAATECLWDA